MNTNITSTRTEHSGLARIAGVALVGFACCHTYGQGSLQPLTITFDGQRPGTAAGVQQYVESGMLFTSYRTVGTNVFPTPDGMVRNGGGISGYPEDGTAYLQAGSRTDTLVCRFNDGRLFDFTSVDLAEYSTVLTNALTVQFVGYFTGGSNYIQTRTTDGIIDGTGPLSDFQTFGFQGFSRLSRLEISTSYGNCSLDNLVVAVPEPTTSGLLGLGTVLLLAWRSRKIGFLKRWS